MMGEEAMAKNTDIATWEQLDEMQRSYLQATYEADQLEARERYKNHSRTKAAEWRWLPFNREPISAHPYYLENDLAIRLHSLSHTLPQARAIFTSLVVLGLVEMRNQTDQQCSKQYLAVQ